MTQSTNPSYMVFIDGTHLDQRCYHCFDRTAFDLDFENFTLALTGGIAPVATHYCTAHYHQSFDPYRAKCQRNMLWALGRMGNGIQIHADGHHKQPQRCKCGAWSKAPLEKGTDVEVACLFLEAAIKRLADRLILVAGDNDYIPALKIARRTGAPWLAFAHVIDPDPDGPNPATQAKTVSGLRRHCHAEITLNEAFLAPLWKQE